jgi:predicted transposase/invertase (TIGR01784 family)
MKSSKQMQMEEIEKAEVFADPTYDVTFKMLFGSEKNKILLVNFLNNILGFKGKDEIKDLNIINSSLIQEDLDAIESAVDVRCKTASGEDISIEMQRRNEDYFLSRTQDYMGKLISSQVKKDEGKKYHIAMNKTYIVIISKAKLFIKDNKVDGDYDTLYEKTIVPMIQELNKEVPHNKMYWKFFELPKFEKFAKDKDINAGSSLKEQWLNFLINCHDQKVVPENVSEIIKAGYEIMKIAKWSKEEKENYELSKIKEAYRLKELEDIEENAFQEGLKKGKWKGEVKGEIKQIKSLLKYKVEPEKIKEELKFLNHEKNIGKFDLNFQYIQDHIDETESQIMGGMDIEMD